ncbi:MAG: hypothetical protein DDT38_00418 [Firmicutes bacterium]|nr:hypothetical protein [candidate division NPL-UPA2 bacterium]
MAHGAWHMAHGTWRMAHGTWHMVESGKRKATSSLITPAYQSIIRKVFGRRAVGPGGSIDEQQVLRHNTHLLH